MCQSDLENLTFYVPIFRTKIATRQYTVSKKKKKTQIGCSSDGKIVNQFWVGESFAALALRTRLKAVASLTVGKSSTFLILFSNFDQFFLIFLKLISFSSSFWLSGWTTCSTRKDLATPLTRRRSLTKGKLGWGLRWELVSSNWLVFTIICPKYTQFV